MMTMMMISNTAYTNFHTKTCVFMTLDAHDVYMHLRKVRVRGVNCQGAHQTNVSIHISLPSTTTLIDDHPHSAVYPTRSDSVDVTTNVESSIAYYSIDYRLPFCGIVCVPIPTSNSRTVTMTVAYICVCVCVCV